jgi:hypothetical protein
VSRLDPGLLAGLLYLGSGAGLAVVTTLQRLRRTAPAGEAPIAAADLPVLMLLILAGGLVGPVLLFLGLARMQASAASLLLNVVSRCAADARVQHCCGVVDETAHFCK